MVILRHAASILGQQIALVGQGGRPPYSAVRAWWNFHQVLVIWPLSVGGGSSTTHDAVSDGQRRAGVVTQSGPLRVREPWGKQGGGTSTTLPFGAAARSPSDGLLTQRSPTPRSAEVA